MEKNRYGLVGEVRENMNKAFSYSYCACRNPYYTGTCGPTLSEVRCKGVCANGCSRCGWGLPAAEDDDVTLLSAAENALAAAEEAKKAAEEARAAIAEMREIMAAKPK